MRQTDDVPVDGRLLREAENVLTYYLFALLVAFLWRERRRSSNESRGTA